MSNRELNASNKKKGNGNGNSVINNHEYSNKISTTSSHTSTNLNDMKDVKKNKNVK